MSNILVFDTETTNLIPRGKSIYANNMTQELLDTMPYIVTISTITYGIAIMDIIKYEDDIIKIPKEVIITPENYAFHKLSQIDIQKRGNPIETIIDKFILDYNKADLIVGHNIYFDIEMMRIELARLIFKKDDNCDKWTSYYRILMNSKSKRYCTCHNMIGKQLCGKTPKLIELYKALFGESPSRLHESLYDVYATLRCYIKMVEGYDICSGNVNLLDECIETERKRIQMDKKFKKDDIIIGNILDKNYSKILTRQSLKMLN